jgi:hypothetical protein
VIFSVVYQRSTALSTRQLRIVASTFGDRKGLVGCAAMINQWITSERAIDGALAPTLRDRTAKRPASLPPTCLPRGGRGSARLLRLP